MDKFARYGIIIMCLTISGISAEDTLEEAKTDDFQILLCADSDSLKNVKLVYTYIDSKKTECMPEYELLQKISRIKSERFPDSLREEDKYAAGYDRITLIKMGKKDFEGEDFSGADLMALDMSGTILRNADFTNSDMRNAIIRSSDLSGADLKAAFLKGADLSGSNLSGTNFSGAYMQRAILKNVKFLNADSLAKAKTLYKADIDSLTYKKLKELNPDLFKDPEGCWNGNIWSKDTDCSKNKRVDKYPRR